MREIMGWLFFWSEEKIGVKYVSVNKMRGVLLNFESQSVSAGTKDPATMSAMNFFVVGGILFLFL